jgi:phthiodiolone/phenolphthiodiolone dimycocerosates ketoreductase
MMLAGTPGEIVEQAGQWRDCGVRYMVLAHLSLLQRSLRSGLASLLPFNNVVQGLKKL